MKMADVAREAGLNRNAVIFHIGKQHPILNWKQAVTIQVASVKTARATRRLARKICTP